MPESHIIGDLGKNDSLGESTATTPHGRDITQLSRKGWVQSLSESMPIKQLLLINTDFL